MAPLVKGHKVPRTKQDDSDGSQGFQPLINCLSDLMSPFLPSVITNFLGEFVIEGV